MTVLIKGPPPIQQVAQLKTNGAVQMYALLWESAYMDIRIDRRRGLSKEERRDCGGTSEWSIKGIADFLGLGKATVLKAMNALLVNGFISIDGLTSTGSGSKKRVFRVTPPNELENRRHAIEIMGTDSLDPHSERSAQEFNDSDVDQYSDESFLDFLSTFSLQQTDAGARSTRQSVTTSVEADGLRSSK